jgi:hypothetical protein
MIDCTEIDITIFNRNLYVASGNYYLDVRVSNQLLMKLNVIDITLFVAIVRTLKQEAK